MKRWAESASFAAFLVALALLPWARLVPLDFISENAHVGDAAIAFSFAFWLSLRLPRRPDALLVLGGAICTLAAIALLAAPERGGGTLAGLATTVEMGVLLALSASFARQAARLRLIVLVVLTTSLLAAAGAAVGALFYWLEIDTGLVGEYGDLTPGDYPRIQAGFEHPAALGSYAIFAAAVVGSADWLPRRLRLGTQVAMAISAVLSLSRAAIGFAVFAVAQRGRREALIAGLVGALAIAFLTVGNLQVDPSDPLRATYDPFTSKSGARWPLLRESVETIQDRPVLGLGPNGLPGPYRLKRAHVTPVQVAGELGLPALFLVVGLIMTLWRRRARPTNAVLWAGLLGLAIDGLGQDVHHFRHVWILLGLAYAVPGRSNPRPGRG